MSHDDSEHPNPGRARRRKALIVGSAVVAVAVLAAATVLIVHRNAVDETSTPDVVALAGPLADQELAWEACEFNDDGPPLPGADVSNVECATIKVPRDWLDPDPDSTWDVRISQAHNIDPSHPDYHTTIIAHPGGPYASGLSYGTAVQLYTPALRPTTNYVSFDQRGLGQSSRVGCEYEYDPAGGPSAAAQAIGAACSQDPEVATMTTEQTAYDMDFIRHLLGLETVTYVGYSYGTWLGTWYGSLFSENIERMVLDSATNSTRPSIQDNYNAAHEGRDRQFRLHMLNWIARNDALIGLGADPEAIWERYFAATNTPEKSQAAQLAWNAVSGPAAFSSPVLYPAAGSLVASIITQSEASPAQPDSVELATRIVEATELPDALRDIADATLALPEAGDSPVPPPAGNPGGPIRATNSYVIEFTACTDGQWTQGLEFWDDFHDTTARTAPLSAQFGLLVTPSCAFWPTDSTMPVPDNRFPESIVLQSELDSMTPFEQGWAAGTGLPNTSLIAVDNESVHGVFPYGTEEVDRPVIDFLLGGDRHRQTIVAAGKPLPLEQSTYESWTPLDENAEHTAETPLFTDPAIPARTGVLQAPSG